VDDCGGCRINFAYIPNVAAITGGTANTITMLRRMNVETVDIIVPTCYKTANISCTGETKPRNYHLMKFAKYDLGNLSS